MLHHKVDGQSGRHETRLNLLKRWYGRCFNPKQLKVNLIYKFLVIGQTRLSPKKFEKVVTGELSEF